MSDKQAAETPLSDHVASFWRDLKDETVQMRVDMRRVIGHDSPDGPTVYWDMAMFGDNVAKALVAERAELTRLQQTHAALVEAMEAKYRQLIEYRDGINGADEVSKHALAIASGRIDQLHMDIGWAKSALASQ